MIFHFHFQIDNKIQELIATLSESIQTPGFDVLHPVGIEVRGKIYDSC